MLSLTVGFTGTRFGMSDAQKYRIPLVLTVLKSKGFSIARHGVCIGADEEFHILARGMGFKIIGHLGHNKWGKSPTRSVVQCDEFLPEKHFIDRDKDIVISSGVMIATPQQFEEVEYGSGTWTTYRIAMRQNKPLYLVFPDGSVEKQNGAF